MLSGGASPSGEAWKLSDVARTLVSGRTCFSSLSSRTQLDLILASALIQQWWAGFSLWFSPPLGFGHSRYDVFRPCVAGNRACRRPFRPPRRDHSHTSYFLRLRVSQASCSEGREICRVSETAA